MASLRRPLRALGLAGLLSVLVASTASAAQPRVSLGTASDFAVLAGSTITNTGSTTITGNVGLHPGTAVTGFNRVTLHGSLHKADAVARSAKQSLVNAYVNAAGRKPGSTIPTELGGTTRKAGVYKTASGTFGLTGTVRLDGEGSSNAVFIFEAASTLVTASSSRVVLINGAQACNVFWRIGSSVTLGTATRFQGNILAHVSITMTTGARLIGRALARNGAVTLHTNVISRPACAGPLGGSAPPPTDTITSPVSVAILPYLLGLAVVFTVGFIGSLRLTGGRRRLQDPSPAHVDVTPTGVSSIGSSTRRPI